MQNAPKKIFILQGNEDVSSLCAHLAEQYAASAEAAGHSVELVHIGDLVFDPMLHRGYKTIQELEPDLVGVQDKIHACDHFVVVYPVWWSTMPALLKGLFDRIWLPGFAFRFKKDAKGKRLLGFDRLLTGKTARVIVTLNNFVLLERFMYGNYMTDIQNAILRFAGFKTEVLEFGNVEKLSPQRLRQIESRIALLAKHAK